MPRYKKYGNALYIKIMERWWPTTNTFHLGGAEVRITPLDFTITIGMATRCGISRVYDDEYVTNKFIKYIFPL